MLHLEIAQGAYAALHTDLANEGVEDYIFYSNTTNERVIYTVLNNSEYSPLQKGQLLVNLFTPKINNLPNTNRISQIKTIIENKLITEFPLPSGNLVYLNEIETAGPTESATSNDETLFILIYEYRTYN